MTQRRSRGMMIAGVVLTGVGAVSLVSGALMLSAANQTVDCTYDNSGYCYQTTYTDSGLQAAGAVFVVIGAASLAAGIPLWIVGSRRVPVTDPSGQQPVQAFVPELRVGAGSAKLRMAF